MKASACMNSLKCLTRPPKVSSMTCWLMIRSFIDGGCEFNLEMWMVSGVAWGLQTHHCGSIGAFQRSVEHSHAASIDSFNFNHFFTCFRVCAATLSAFHHELLSRDARGLICSSYCWFVKVCT